MSDASDDYIAPHDPSGGYAPGSLESSIFEVGGYGNAIPGMDRLGQVANFLRNSGAPAGYDWSDVLARTAAAQKSQFGGWSSFDDPGQTASKIFSNVSDPWGRTADLNLRGSNAFAQSQAEGARMWDIDAHQPTGLFGTDMALQNFVLASLGGGLGSMAYNGAGVFAPAAGTGLGEGSAWAGTAAADDALVGAGGAWAGGGGGTAGSLMNASGGFPMPPAGPVPSGSMWDNILKTVKGVTSNPTVSAARNLYNIGSGIYGLKQAGDLKKSMASIAAGADPFGAQRAQYAQQLSALMANPGQIVNDPSYKAGEQAIMRKMASQGYLGSGNMMNALKDFGGNQFEAAVARLAQLAGAGINPGTGAQINAQGQIGATQLRGNALNRIGYGISGGY